MKYINICLVRGENFETRIKNSNVQQLNVVKDQLMDEMGAPIGWHTMGVPLAFSLLCILLSYTMPQVFIWHLIFNWFSLPEYAIFVGIIPSSLVFCIITVIVLMLISRGYARAFKTYLALHVFNAVLNIGYLISLVMMFILRQEYHIAYIYSAILGISLIAISIKLLNSAMFVKTLTYYFHNRVWRSLLQINQ